MLEHPAITNMERTGWPGGKEPKEPRCPVCGENCEVIYQDLYGVFVGCDVCMKARDAYEIPNCFFDLEDL